MTDEVTWACRKGYGFHRALLFYIFTMDCVIIDLYKDAIMHMVAIFDAVVTERRQLYEISRK